MTETEFSIKKLGNKEFEFVVICSVKKNRHFESIGIASSEEPEIKKYKTFNQVMSALLETSKKRAYRNIYLQVLE